MNRKEVGWLFCIIIFVFVFLHLRNDPTSKFNREKSNRNRLKRKNKKISEVFVIEFEISKNPNLEVDHKNPNLEVDPKNEIKPNDTSKKLNHKPITINDTLHKKNEINPKEINLNVDCDSISDCLE